MDHDAHAAEAHSEAGAAAVAKVLADFGLVAVLEGLARHLGMTVGEWRLETVFRDGAYRHIYRHNERLDATAVRRFDSES